jgi:HK97 family phage major capsid protein
MTAPATAYRPVSILPTGTAVARYIQALALGCDDMYTALQKAETWRDTPHVKATLELRMKAAVASASTTDSTWAGPLASYGIAAEAVGILRGLSIFGALESKMQRVPLHVKIPVETGAGFTGGWVAEGAAIPVQKTAYSTSTEENYKYGVIVPLSEELVTTSDPAAIPTINRTVLGGLAKAIDTQLLTPTVAVSAGVNPASILNGSTEITTTGSTAATIAADLAGMLAAVTTPGPLVWIMKPKTLYRISLTLGSQAAGLPNTLFGIPVIASINSPAQIALLDPGAILFSDSGGFELDVSRNALLELNDAPANPTVAGSIMHSMLQRNDVAIKAMRSLAWLNLTPTTAASFMSVSY